MITYFKKIANRLIHSKKGGKKLSTIQYWENRSHTHGKRAVLNLAHSENEYDDVTNYQISEIFPYLRKFLNGDEKLVLDYGCGPGRFSASLARLTGGKVIAIDPIKSFLEIAPKTSSVEYKLLQNNKIPLENKIVDLIWICLVLGGLKDNELHQVRGEIKRVLKPNGLICLVENTSSRPNNNHWFFRDYNFYKGLFNFATITHAHDYFDVGERISVMIGRSIT